MMGDYVSGSNSSAKPPIEAQVIARHHVRGGEPLLEHPAHYRGGELIKFSNRRAAGPKSAWSTLEALGVDILNRNQVPLAISLSKFFGEPVLLFRPPQVNLKLVRITRFQTCSERANDATPTSLNFVSRAKRERRDRPSLFSMRFAKQTRARLERLKRVIITAGDLKMRWEGKEPRHRIPGGRWRAPC